MLPIGNYRSYYAVFTTSDGREQRLDSISFVGPFNAYRLSVKARLFGVDAWDRSILLGEQG